MQVAHVKPVFESQLKTASQMVDEIYAPALSQKSDKASDKVKVQEANILSLQKPKSLNRLLEAYSDCV